MAGILLVLIQGAPARPDVPPAKSEAARTRKDAYEFWVRYNGYRVKSFKVEGVPEDMARDLVSSLAFQGQRKLLKGMVRPEFSVKTLAEDLARIRLYLARRGYPGAVVVPEAVADDNTDQMDLMIKVNPGPAVRIAKVELVGWPESEAFPDTSLPGVPKAGQLVNDEKLTQNRLFLGQTLMNAGYAKVKINTDLQPVGPGQVLLQFRIELGDAYQLTELEVTGCSEDLVPVARRVMNVNPVVPYSLELMENASLDLRTTQLFGMVNLATEETAPGKMKMTAVLEDAKMRNWDASVGTWVDNPWMVQGGWTHRNLFSNGVGFDVSGVFATHTRELAAGVFWLGWLSPRARTRVSGGLFVDDEDAYLSREYRLEAMQSFRPRNRDIWNFGVTLSENDVDEKQPDADDVPEDQGRLLELWSDKKWDRTDDPISPSKGGYFKVSLTVAPPEVISEIPYVLGQLDGMLVKKLFSPFLLAVRGRVGVAKPLGDTVDILVNRRFYAGGYNTHRGYERRRLGPRDNNNNPRGGEGTALAGAELRFPLFWILGGAVFCDAGNVWRKPDEMNWTSFAVALGWSVEFQTPLGPLRGGYASNVSGLYAGEPTNLWHFGIGYPW